MSNQLQLKDAQTYTAEWRQDESDYNKYNECNAFLVPLADLQQLVAEMGNSDDPNAKVRAYLGVKKTYNDKTQGYDFEEKLIFVGTKACSVNGETVYRDLIAGYTPQCDNELSADPATLGGGGIWDFTDPCPPDCDPNSPLN